MSRLHELNQLDATQAYNWFEQCCASPKWCQVMVDARPYETIEQVKNYASLVWRDLDQQEYLKAFEAHPMIGDLKSLKKKFANTGDVAQQEQSGTAQADPEVLTRLQTLNQRYLQKNGFIFIICASGLTAEQMLDALESRINNPEQHEIEIAAAQQMNITLLRIEKLLT